MVPLLHLRAQEGRKEGSNCNPFQLPPPPPSFLSSPSLRHLQTWTHQETGWKRVLGTPMEISETEHRVESILGIVTRWKILPTPPTTTTTCDRRSCCFYYRKCGENDTGEERRGKGEVAHIHTTYVHVCGHFSRHLLLPFPLFCRAKGISHERAELQHCSLSPSFCS